MTDGDAEGAPLRSGEELQAAWVEQLRPMDAPVRRVEPGPARARRARDPLRAGEDA